MPNMLQRGTSWFDERTKSAGGRTITYQQKGQDAISLTATQEIKEYTLLSDSGTVDATGRFMSTERFESTDWFVTKADMQGIVPRKGDRILETIDSVEHAYEVLPVGKRPPSERFDTFGTMLIIHSKRATNA